MFDASSRYTCGDRIEYLQTADGGSLGEIAAKEQISLDFPNECSPCWPWLKYKLPGDTSVSPKRGIALERKFVTEQGLTSLRTVVSWGYGWDAQLLTDERVRWMPMIWGEGQLLQAEDQVGVIDWGGAGQALLGFNEPNFPEQADMSPERAAALWPRVEALAANRGLSKLVSPAVNFRDGNQGVDWLRRFFELCVGCKVDAIAFHSYTCYGRFLRDHLDLYRVFGKPMWLTEFACSEPGAINAGRASAEGQMTYMREAIPLLENDPDVEMYAWFSYFQDQWAHPIGGVTGDAGLVRMDGTLSALGSLYATFK